jgi:2,3-dimethylmalate lyase
VTTAARRLRELVGDGRSHLVVSAYDAFSARIAESAGSEILHLSGYGASASLVGLPDIGLLTVTEITEVSSHISAVTDRPLIVDADTGYGGLTNVHRTVRLLESTGAAGLHLEDQADPKRCGHMKGKRLIPSGEMAAKIEAAVNARRDDDFVIIARTDAIAVEGFEAALERAQKYLDAGADMLLVDAPETVEQIEDTASRLEAPLVFDWAYGGATPSVSRKWLEQLGYCLIIFPDIIQVTHKALATFHAAIGRADSLDDLAPTFTPFDEFNDFLGLGEWASVEDRFAESHTHGSRR